MSRAASISRVRRLLTTLVFALPATPLKNRLLNLLGHHVHPTARIGICWVQHVDRFELAEGVRIGNFNAFRYLALVKMGYGSRIVMFNWILGGSGFEPGARQHENLRTLRMGEHSHIISFHFLECGGGLVMDDNCWITGIRSTVLSHAFDPKEGGIILEPVELRKGAIVSTSCTMLPGTVIGEGSLLAAGSTTWTGQAVVDGALAGGVPARRLANIDIPEFVYDRHRYGGQNAL